MTFASLVTCRYPRFAPVWRTRARTKPANPATSPVGRFGRYVSTSSTVKPSAAYAAICEASHPGIASRSARSRYESYRWTTNGRAPPRSVRSAASRSSATSGRTAPAGPTVPTAPPG